MRSASDSLLVLGLNFGHDASATVVEDGRILSYVSRERITRKKHVLGLDSRVIKLALLEAGKTLSELDTVAVTSTQSVELISSDPDALAVRYTGVDPFDRPLNPRFAGLNHQQIASLGRRGLKDLLENPIERKTTEGRLFSQLMLPGDTVELALGSAVPWLNTFVVHAPWKDHRTLAGLNEIEPEIREDLRYGFHVPVVVTIDDFEICGYAIHHHLAHAASSYYISGFTDAAVFTHDGYGFPDAPAYEMLYDAGMFYLGASNAIYPVWPHGLSIGHLYERVGSDMGLAVVGSPGKLMGLAAYGRPTFYSSEFVDNWTGLANRYDEPELAWLHHCGASDRASADSRAINPRPSSHDSDIAASTQKLFEQVRRQTVAIQRSVFSRAGWETGTVCLSGGTALNCPSNSEIGQLSGVSNLFVEPACDDGGISIGAALAVNYSILDRPLRNHTTNNRSPFLGSSYSESNVVQALNAFRDVVISESCADAVRSAAEDLAADRVVAWCEGRSEIGPRALGHRSLLADPRHVKNWSRVNALKGREEWRPFAPAVLAEHASDWFSGTVLPSPYMLFNARVRDGGLPAVTHVDGTARLQTVDQSCGDFNRLLIAFYELTGVPVLLNTSLNGPGEPIVESPNDALACFVTCGFDVLYIDGFRVMRTSSIDQGSTRGQAG